MLCVVLALVIFQCSITILANPYLTLRILETSTAYFNTTFEVGTSDDSLAQVNCTIECPGGLVSTVLAEMLTNPAQIQIPAPGYNGTCLASIEAVGYLSAISDLTVFNFTQCQATTATPDAVFNATSNATISASFSLSGPLGNIFALYVVVPQNISDFFPVSSYSGLLTKDSYSQLFYQTNCTNSSILLIGLSDGGTLNLMDGSCSTYPMSDSPPTIYQPYTPFYQLYGTQAQGQYNFTTFLNPSAPDDSQGNFSGLFTQICLAANYIVAQTDSELILPSSTITFTAYLGLNQSMSTLGAAELSCGSLTTTVSFNLTNTPEEFAIETPATSTGDYCTLYVYNDPEPEAYAAPVKIFLISAYLILQVPSTTVSAGSLLAYQAYVNYDSNVEMLAALNLYCGNQLVGSQNITTSDSTQYFMVPTSAIGVCQFNASTFNSSFANSTTIDLTVNQPLSIASSLTGWTSGSAVTLNITSPNLVPIQLSLVTTCSIGSIEATFPASILTSMLIPSTVNGAQCLLSTPGLPAYYLPFPQTFVNIAISPSLVVEIVQQINPASFIDPLKDESNQQQQKSLKKLQVK